MKTKIIAIMACVAMLVPSNITAQEASKSYDYFGKMKTDHWTVNAQGFYSVGPARQSTIVGVPFCGCPGKYWGVAANVQRKFYMIKNSGFWFGPGAGINFSWVRGTNWSRETIKKFTEFGLELNGLAGYTFGNNHIGIDFFAGIVGRLGLYKVQNRYWPGTGFARMGFSLMRGHLSLTGAFDIAFTHYRHCSTGYDVEAANAITFGIGYSF